MFDWLLYLNVADKLVSLESEAGFRSAVSRAYYGAFGEVRKNLETNGLVFSQFNVHQQVIEQLTNHTDPSIKKIGWDLNLLRIERNRSDYNARVSINKLSAEKSVILARSIVHNMQQTQPQ